MRWEERKGGTRDDGDRIHYLRLNGVDSTARCKEWHPTANGIDLICIDLFENICRVSVSFMLKRKS